MRSEENKELVRRTIGLWYAPESVEELRSCVADDYVHHTANGDLEFDQFATELGYIAATFSEPEYTIVHVLAEDDMAAAFIRYRAIHSGSFAGVEATGRPISTEGAYHCRIANGRIQEDWDVWGLLSILRQVQAASLE